MAKEPNQSPIIPVALWRFSLRQLFLWTAFIALGCVALTNASATWIAAMLGLAFVLLAASILLVVFRRGGDRAYWIGFATFGWLYMLLVLFSWNIDPNKFGDHPFRPSNLVTTRLSNASYHWLYDAAFQRHFASNSSGGGYGGSMGGGMSMMGSGMMPGLPVYPYPGAGGMAPGGMSGMAPMPTPPPGPSEGDFANVAHALWAILLAALGGGLAHWLYATGPGRREQLAGLVANSPHS